MKLPYILIVDDDEQVLGAIQRDVRNQYREEYRIASTSSAAEALELLKELKLNNDIVALIISDQKMPEMEGVDFLEEARKIFTESKQVLLTAYSDINAAIKAINDIKLDYYLLKPWNPPEEKLYPVLDELLDEWQSHYKPDHEGIRVIGFQWSPKSHNLKEFLSGNLVPYLWMDIEANENSEQYLISAGVSKNQLPLVVFTDGTFLADPEINEVAAHIGLRLKASETVYDVVIIGAGPAGLAASVYGSCEGLKTLLIEQSTPGGQAGGSSRIENYLGFPAGLSGAELTRRAIAQTKKFGTEILNLQTVKSIRLQDGYKIVELMDGSIIHTKSIVIASGVQYAKLAIDGIDKFNGAGVYYGSASVEAHSCKGENVYIVGSGNSACQAALYISKFASQVNILIRKDKLIQTAANYLVEQIHSIPNIVIHANTEVKGVEGENFLERLTLKNNKSGEEVTVSAKALFIYIGTKPSTDWVGDLLLKDEKGFIYTGRELMKEKSFNAKWKPDRDPYLMESIIPGIFVAGDVRHGGLAGISSAVGDGTMAIRFARKYLQEI